MLAELEKSEGGRPGKTVTHTGESLSPYKDVLDTAGLSYNKAAQWQQVAGAAESRGAGRPKRGDGIFTTDGKNLSPSKSSPYKESLVAAGVSYKEAAQWQLLAVLTRMIPRTKFGNNKVFLLFQKRANII